jgi:hypothetical protein
MKIIGSITLKYKNEKYAQLVFDSLNVDNENFLKSKLDQESITYNITSEKLGTFLATADDLIASEIVVEKIINNTEN